MFVVNSVSILEFDFLELSLSFDAVELIDNDNVTFTKTFHRSTRSQCGCDFVLTDCICEEWIHILDCIF